MTPADPTTRFTAIVAAGPVFDLGEAAALVAAHARPELDVGDVLGELDELAASCPDPSLEGLRAGLFGVAGFHGNTVAYDDPDNSFLDQVLRRRTGIPITLSVVMIEVGRRIGVPIAGIGLPGHFIVRHLDSPAVLVDPFHGGRLLQREDCDALVRQLSGGRLGLESSMLEPVPPAAIVTRMLANLRHVFAQRGDHRSLEWTLRLRAAMPDAAAADVAQLARVQSSLGMFLEAADSLERVADLADADAPRQQARLLRARLN